MHAERHLENREGLWEVEIQKQGLGTPEPKHVGAWNWLRKTGRGSGGQGGDGRAHQWGPRRLLSSFPVSTSQMYRAPSQEPARA